MRKILIDDSASFFFELSQKHLYNSKERKKYLLTLLEKEYPAVNDKIIWDYCIFTFEKKKFALVTVINRDLYEERKVKYSSCVFTTEISVIASKKDFIKRSVPYRVSNQQIFYDIQEHEPKILFISDCDKNEKIFETREFSEKDIRKSKPVFYEKQYKSRLSKVCFIGIISLSFIIAICLFFVPSSAEYKNELYIYEDNEQISGDPIEPPSYSSLSSFLNLSHLFVESKSLIESFVEDEKGHIILKSKTEKPSELLEKITNNKLFTDASITSMKKKAGSKEFECVFELNILEKPLNGDLPQPLVIESLTHNIPMLKNAETSIKGFVLETTPDGLNQFMKQYSEFENNEKVILKNFNIESDVSKILVKGEFAQIYDDSIQFPILKENDFSDINASLLFKKIPQINNTPLNEIIEKIGMDSNEIGRIYNSDGTYTVYKKDTDGKIISERKK